MDFPYISYRPQVYNLLGCLAETSSDSSACIAVRCVPQMAHIPHNRGASTAGRAGKRFLLELGFAMADSPLDRSNAPVEHLTHREREILARLAGDLYGREIAEVLMLSPNSVKWYTRQIYAKLGVNSRQDAIRRARELGLLEPKTGPSFRSPNLPAALTPFVGRQTELEQIRELLADPTYRLVTLTGAGGVGKTRLALRIATELQGNYPQGAWLVELASLSDPGLVLQTVAAAFDLRLEQGQSSLNVLVDYLRNRNLLLVLDNCEHLVAACASLATDLLQTCPDLHILATSREILGIKAERIYLVPPLAFPMSGEKMFPQELLKYEAVDLFTRRAKVALPDFRLAEENAKAVIQICQHLDGIPLGLELAAARLRELDVEQIASQLEDCFHLLTGGDRSAQPRLQTMRTSIDWSYQLLSEAEKSLLRRLAVFAGGWNLAAAKVVCADDSLPEADILDLLRGLVNKSLVLVVRRRGQEVRYRLLETVHQYAQEKLSELGEARAIRDRHLNYFLWFAEHAEPELLGADQAAWFDRLELEHDNFRLALDWSLGDRGAGPEVALQMAGSLWWFWFVRGYKIEGSNWLVKTLTASKSQTPADLVTRANALAKLPWLEYFQVHSLKEALALGRTLGPAGRESIALALWGLGTVALEKGDHVRARSLEERSLKLFRALGNRWGVCETLTRMGLAMIGLGEFQQATVCLEESLELAKQAGDSNEIAFAIQSLGEVALARGDHQQAVKFFEESSMLYHGINMRLVDWSGLGDIELQKGNTRLAISLYKETLTTWVSLRKSRLSVPERHIALSLESLAHAAAVCKQPERAVRLLGAAEALRESSGQALFPNEILEYERFLENLYPQLDQAMWTARWAEGRGMTLEEAIAYALGEKES